ncbi:MAG TPA: hypothetical protein IAB38_04125 [Candidatus Onthousia excrementipullorum]|uniref:Uncharacterized protein n=1 Tax=Candidatus Onthousia excrementipullorum TaxID=2840884 RepID=A0A9D1DUC8_9FIRM|nr:hypothetical protein [Candidatus Onthousia excrementipullorum]
MIFRISISLIQIIINPDTFKDKEKGAGSLIKRIAVMLVMLTLIAPINIPEDQLEGHPLNQQINTNGILFGFLYQFQNSVVQDQVLAKLILGYNGSSDSLELNGMDATGDIISAQIAKAFITPTLNSSVDADNVTSEQLKDSDNLDEYVACPDVVINYIDDTVSASGVLDHVNDICGSNGETYAFEYTPVGGLVVSIVMTVIVIGFTLDIAVRAIKLAILRLIAPVPIISYVNPGADKNGPFGNWVKTLASTYLSLFIRLIIIYFGVYLIILLKEGTLITWVGTSNFFISTLANIFIIIGILVFMKDAPKFFQDMLGIKGDGKLFSGIGTMLGAAALTGGLAGSIATNYRSARDEVLEDGGSKRKARAMGALSGVGGAIGGLFAGGKALATADKKQAGAVFSAMQKRNAVRASGASLPRRAITGASAMFTGQAPGAHEEQLLEAYNNVTKAAKAHQKMLEDEAVNDGTVVGTASKFGNIGVSASGRAVALSGNYKDIVNRINQARAEGKNDLVLANGDMFSLDDINENVLEDLRKDQARNYAGSAAALANAKVQGTAEELKYAADAAQMKIDVNNYDSVKNEGIGTSMNNARKISTSTKSARYRAAARHVGAPPPGGGKPPRH